MSLENSKYWNHILCYFSDSISDKEEKELFNWLNDNPNLKEEFNKIKVIWESLESRPKKSKSDVEEIWRELKLKMEVSPDETQIKKLRPKPTALWLKIAAGIVFLCGIGFLLMQDNEDAPVVMVEIVTPADSTNSFYLPDSSHIILNENSTFTYPEVFAENERNVTLNGEAYFEVTPNTEKPFTAFAGSTKTKVVGTSFNINAREENDEVEVEVFEGEVELSDIDDSKESKKNIKKHEKGTYSKSKKSTSKKKSSKKQPKWVRKITKSKPVKHMKKEFKGLYKDWKKEL